jgi:hypothetical protein
MKKVFFSWQTDIPNNKSFLTSCIRDAVVAVGDFELISPTQYMRGSGDVTVNIINRIRECDLLIADVTLINPRARTRKTPNPNVIYEVGFATAEKGEQTITLVADERTTHDTNLPFDIRNRRTIYTKFDSQHKRELVELFKQILSEYEEPEPSLPRVTLVESSCGWANWGGPGQGSGFRYRIRIDNYGRSADYVTNIRIETKDDQDNPWTTTHFKFDEIEVDEALAVGMGEMADVSFFATDQLGVMQRQFPDLDIDTVNIVLTWRSVAEETTLNIPASKVRHL